MSSILYWFCCGCATDEPEPYQYHHHPPPPTSQTQVVTVVQASQPVHGPPPPHEIHNNIQLPPPLPSPALPPAPMGYARPPPQLTAPWQHVPFTAEPYDRPPQPATWSPVPHPVYAPSPPFAQAVPPPPRRGDSPPPSKTYLQAPPAEIQEAVSSKRYGSPAPSVALPPTPTLPRATTGVHDCPSLPRSTIPSRVPSRKAPADEPIPAPVVPSQQRSPQAAWPARQPSKTYRMELPEPPPVPAKSYNNNTQTPAWSEDLPPADSIVPRAQQPVVQSNRFTFQNETTLWKN